VKEPAKRRLRRAGVILLVLVGIGALPPVRDRARALAVVAEALGLPWPRPFAPEVTRDQTSIGGVVGDLYLPGDDAPALLLVPGAAKQGKDDPRVVRLARTLARSGRTVFVPSLELAERRFVHEDIERLVAAIDALSQRSGRPVVVLGISYGGSFALIASADERVTSDIEQIAVFGAYFDVVGLIQAATTRTSVVNGRRIPWDPDPRALDVVERYSLRLAPERQRSDLKVALEDNTGAPSKRLPARARAVYDLVTNRDPEKTYVLARKLTPEARRFLSRFSPSSVADEIRAPVIALHSRDDPVVPYGEAERLVRGIPGTKLTSVSLFRHVSLSGVALLRALPDLIRASTFADRVLSAQD
jgi:pimeloyl-ACP methyl ester carboxylesterase